MHWALIGWGIEQKTGASGGVAATTGPLTTREPTTTHQAETTPGIGTPTTVGTPPARPHKPRVTLTVEAVRGDSWVELRVGSSSGRILYSGILARGESMSGKGSRLWARFGSVGNLDLRLNGKPVRTAHSGTVNALVTPSGLH